MIDSSYKLKPVRTNSSYKFLTKFDYVDNKFLFCYFQPNLPNLSKIFVQAKFPRLSSKTCLLVTGITVETLNQQRVLIQNSKENFFPTNSYLNSTLRKTKLWTVLDICLITLFLDKLLLSTSNYDKINQKLHIFFSPKIIEKFNFQTIKHSIHIFNYSAKSEKLNPLSLITYFM